MTEQIQSGAQVDKTTKNTRISQGFRAYLIITALLCGGLIMVVEVLGSRVIGPFFGVSLFVWTSLIAVTLIALALGYAVGGFLSDRKGTPEYLYGIILIAGLLVFIIPWLKADILKLTVPMGLRMGTFVSATMMFGPSLFLLGCVSPYLVKVAADEMRNLGRTVGGLYALSTLGSVIGTSLTGFVLIAYLGVDRIFTLVGLTLISLALGYFLIFKRRMIVAAAFVLLFFLPTPPSHSGMTKLMDNGTRVTLVKSVESFYGSLKVVDYQGTGGHIRELVIDGLIQGGVDLTNQQSIYEYAYFLQFLPYAKHPTGENALIIGLGAGIMPVWYEAQGIRTDVVDIDPAVVDMARQYFGFDVTGEVHIADARYYLANAKEQYDYVILDVFNGDTTPAHLLSLEALQLLRGRMTEQGIVGINMVGSLKREPYMTASVIHTLRQVFEQVEVYPTFDEEVGFGNLAIIAYQGEKRGFDATKIEQFPVHPLAREAVVNNLNRQVDVPAGTPAITLTDDYNPIDFFDSWIKERVRKNIIETTDWDILIHS